MESIKARIAKLLALADKAGTPAEAENAMDKAMAIALKYGLELSMIRDEEAEKTNDPVGVMLLRNLPTEQWVYNIANAVAEFYAGTAFLCPDGKGGQHLGILCHQSMRDVIDSFVGYLFNEIRRGNRNRVSALGLDQKSRARFRKSYRIGASRRIAARLMERINAMKTNDAAAQEATGQNALVVMGYFDQRKSETDKAAEQMGLQEGRSSGQSIPDVDAFLLGDADGRNVSLDPQIAQPRSRGLLS